VHSLGWGWNQADSLRSFDRLRTVSGVEPLAGDHAHGVTAQCKKATRNFLRGY
jgi:hypothetical protein